MAKWETVMPRTRQGTCQIPRQQKRQGGTKKKKKEVCKIAERKTSSPQPALQLCSSYTSVHKGKAEVKTFNSKSQERPLEKKKKKKKRRPFLA